jgi:hypothetical protein
MGFEVLFVLEMRRYADAQTENTMQKDRKSKRFTLLLESVLSLLSPLGLSAKYSCLFGMAKPIPGIEPGSVHRYHGKRYSFLNIGGRGVSYWFLFNKMDKKYSGDDIPRFTATQADAQAERFANHFVGNVSFREVWERRTISRLVALAESHNENWCYGRFACVGNSIHKVTPNAGSGGNGAVESATALTNSLYKLLHEHQTADRVSFSDVSKALKKYHNLRKDRSKLISKRANEFTRHEAFEGWKYRLLTLYFLPIASNFMVDMASSGYVGAPMLDFLSKPKRSTETTIPFSLEHGVGKDDSKWKRLFLALPFIGLHYAADSAFGGRFKTTTSLH